jgi:hypothetical protein
MMRFLVRQAVGDPTAGAAEARPLHWDHRSDSGRDANGSVSPETI